MDRLVIVLGCFVLGCSGEPTKSAASGAADLPSSAPAGDAAAAQGASAPKTPRSDLATISAEVPAPFKEKLVFEARKVTAVLGTRSEVYSVFAPKSWKPGDMAMFAKLSPEQPSEDFGNLTELHFSSNCDGACEAKDWGAVSEKVDFAQFREATFKVLKDEVSKSSHLMVATTVDDATTYIRYAWWDEGGTRYFGCAATLGKGFGPDAPDLRPLVPTFEKVCQSVGYEQQRTN